MGKRILVVLTLILPFVYFVCGLLLLPFYRHQLNPDGIGYISVAERYLARDFNSAVNGYWSPLLSWLLVPLLAFKIDSILAAKILNLVFGFFVMLIACRLSQKLKVQLLFRTVLLLCLAPMLIYYVYSVISPDLLAVLLLLIYLDQLLELRPSTLAVSNSAICGLLGSLIYFAKSYHFFFFPVHFAAVGLILYFQSKKKTDKKRVRQWLTLGLLTFLTIGTVWIYLISSKYGYFTISTAGNFNHDSINPNVNIYPDNIVGLFKSPYQSAYSYWDDPSYIKLGQWSIFGSLSNFLYQNRLILKNINKTINLLQTSSFFAMAILVLLFLDRKHKLILFSTLMLYPLGYWPLAVEGRYLWLMDVLILLYGCLLLQKLVGKIDSKLIKTALIIFFLVSFVRMPIIGLKDIRNSGKEIYRLSQTVRQALSIKSAKTASFGNYADSLCLNYYLKAQYFGDFVNNKTKSIPPNMFKQLLANKIDYFFVWDGAEKNLSLQEMKEITNNKFNNLKIYQATAL